MHFETAGNLAYVFEDGDIKQKILPMDELPDGWVRLKVLARGICGTDIQKIKATSPWQPLVLGHEFVGVVVEESKNVGLVGKTVIGMPLLPCEQCENCRCGNINLCSHGRAIGRTHPGAFAQYVALPASCCFRLPNSMSVIAGVLTDVVAVALHAINQVPMLKKKHCLIIGDGALGYVLACLLSMRHAQVTLVGKDKQKSVWFDKVLDRFVLYENGVLDCAYEYVFETVGRQQNETLHMAIDAVKPKGSIIILGVFAEKFRNDAVLRDLLIKESRIIGSNAYTIVEFKAAIQLINDNLDLFESLITHNFGFSEAVKGFTQMTQKPDPTLKVVISNK